MSLTFARSSLGAFVRSPLGARAGGEAVPAVGISQRDFLEFIAHDNAGTFNATLRLHGDVRPNTVQVNKINCWTAAHAVTPELIGSSNSPLSDPVVFTFNPALTTTICNGQPADTPLGFTDIFFPLGSGNVALNNTVLRVRLERTGDFGSFVLGEHWTDLVHCATIGDDNHYAPATRILWGQISCSSFLREFGQVTVCDEPAYNLGAGNVLTQWGSINPQPSLATVSVLFESWFNPGETFDFTGYFECGSVPGEFTRFNFLTVMDLSIWSASNFREGGVLSTTGEWLAYTGAYTWPDFE